MSVGGLSLRLWCVQGGYLEKQEKQEKQGQTGRSLIFFTMWRQCFLKWR